MNLTQIIAPQSEPLTLDEARSACRVPDDIGETDPEIDLAIASARWMAENITGRQLITATWKLSLDKFPPYHRTRFERHKDTIELPRPPCQSVTSVTYYDADDVQQTLSTSLYEVDYGTEPARLRPVDGETWPDTYPRLNAVEITYVAGYGDGIEAMPECVRTWMLAYVRALYDGMPEVPDMSNVNHLLDPIMVARI